MNDFTEAQEIQKEAIVIANQLGALLTSAINVRGLDTAILLLAAAFLLVSANRSVGMNREKMDELLDRIKILYRKT